MPRKVFSLFVQKGVRISCTLLISVNLRRNSRWIGLALLLTFRKTIDTCFPFAAYLAAKSIALFPQPITTIGPGWARILASAELWT